MSGSLRNVLCSSNKVYYWATFFANNTKNVIKLQLASFRRHIYLLSVLQGNINTIFIDWKRVEFLLPISSINWTLSWGYLVIIIISGPTCLMLVQQICHNNLWDFRIYFYFFLCMSLPNLQKVNKMLILT